MSTLSTLSHFAISDETNSISNTSIEHVDAYMHFDDASDKKRNEWIDSVSHGDYQ
jgi:hypothetical protein